MTKPNDGRDLCECSRGGCFELRTYSAHVPVDNMLGKPTIEVDRETIETNSNAR